MRVGIGHDTHRLVEGRPLVLGGVRVAHSRGLAGHSDADVVLHAVTDALLGAAGLGDIGEAYPDSDPAYRDCDSTLFVRQTLARLAEAGWRLVNLDAILFAQEPKLGSIKADIRRRLAQLLGLDPSRRQRQGQDRRAGRPHWPGRGHRLPGGRADRRNYSKTEIRNLN